MTAAERAVRLAARMLPADRRERYREQWLADVRDATEAGVSRTGLALGALAFAAAADRPWPVRRPGPIDPERRSRLAQGLALSAALLALSQWSPFVRDSGWMSIHSEHGVGSSGVYLYSAFFSLVLGSAYSVLAPIVAIVLVSARGVPRSVRWTVWGLSLASTVPLVRSVLDASPGTAASIYVTPGEVAYVAAAAIVLVAGVVISRLRGQGALRAPDRVRGGAGRAVLAAALVGSASGVALAICVAAWVNRVPLVYGYPATPEYDGMRAEWLALKAQFEALVTTVFIVSGVVAVLLALLTGFIVRHRERRASVLATITVVSIAGVGFAALVDFLWLGTPTGAPPVATDAVLLVARWALVVSVLAGVGGIRFERRARPLAVSPR